MKNVLLALVATARFAFRGDHRLAEFGRWMTLTTAISAVFAFCTGMIAVSNYIQEHCKGLDDGFMILVQGTGEALNCITLGLMLCTLAVLLLAVGYRRFPSRAASGG